ncbi:uncharacterized protein LOC128490296 [Spea bombifrons]|uniref:uncharacterized protein LOC128490296 n=1 Tax=Spea bombifrons TaxID=233779 RepID=UPI00234BEA6F|nr:uncharacterized protein LOC128490296 [Spea bombifrons]
MEREACGRGNPAGGRKAQNRGIFSSACGVTGTIIKTETVYLPPSSHPLRHYRWKWKDHRANWFEVGITGAAKKPPISKIMPGDFYQRLGGIHERFRDSVANLVFYVVIYLAETQIGGHTVYKTQKSYHFIDIMEATKQDAFFNKTSVSSLMVPWGIAVDRGEMPLRGPYGVTFGFDAFPRWDGRYSGHFSYIPFESHLRLCDYSLEPAFIRKRNERERQRVRCVNEGYARLRQHLPQDLTEKRLSKVETLRAAIDYIKRLQELLDLECLGSPAHETSPQSVFPRRECQSHGRRVNDSTHAFYKEDPKSQVP